MPVSSLESLIPYPPTAEEEVSEEPVFEEDSLAALEGFGGSHAVPVGPAHVEEEVPVDINNIDIAALGESLGLDHPTLEGLEDKIQIATLTTMSATQSQTATPQEKGTATLQDAEVSILKKKIATHQDVVVTKRTIATSQEPEAVQEKSMVDQKNAIIQSARDPQVVTKMIEDIKVVPGNQTPLPTVSQLMIPLET